MKTYIYIFTILLLAHSCTKDFEDINTNGNEPESVAPDMILPYIIYKGVDTDISGSLVTQQMAAEAEYNADRGQYNWFDSPYWNYSLLNDVNNMIGEAERMDNENFKGIGLIFKSFLFSRITDCVGDIPYSEALKAKEEIFTPKFDSQQSVYEGLLADLETANEQLDPNGSGISGDIMYNGDILKWKKFANSLHLRLLMRVSDKIPDAKTKIKAIVDNPGKYPIFESNNDMAALTYLPDSPNRYPNYDWTGLDAGEAVMGKPLVDTMLKYSDKRLTVIARPTEASTGSGNPQYVGVPGALPIDSANRYNGGVKNQSRLSKRYNEANTEKGVYMSYAELQFILAEAAQKGWINKDPKTHYENGIRGSFAYYGIADQAEAYIQGPLVTYNPSSGLIQIGVQKWISFFFNSGYEPYFDYRRTGIPYLEPGYGNRNGGKIPVRWKYPDSQQTFNMNNYQQVIQTQGPDNINTKMWLIK